jgi:hypothetical protein
MGGSTRTRLSIGAALLVVLLAWLVPSPLPWRSPLQARANAGAEPADLAAGAAVVGKASGSFVPSPSGAPKPTGSNGPTGSTGPSGSGVPAPRPIVPPAFKGTWRGQGGNFLTGDKFTVIVTIPVRPAGSAAATADFLTYGCQETWQLEQSTPKVLTLRATLTGGVCIVRPLRVQVTLIDRLHVLVQWRLLNSVIESQAQLSRVA